MNRDTANHADHLLWHKEFERAIILVGERNYRDNSVVCNALRLIRDGKLHTEGALALIVQILAHQNDKLMDDVCKVAASRPLAPIIFEKKD